MHPQAMCFTRMNLEKPVPYSDGETQYLATPTSPTAPGRGVLPAPAHCTSFSAALPGP